MKKVLVLAVAMLLVCSAMAMGSATLWSINIKADAPGFASDKINMVGVSTAYTNGVDSGFAFASKQFGQEGTPPPASLSSITQLRVIASGIKAGYADFRNSLSPGSVPGATAFAEWSFTIAASSGGSPTDPGAPFMVTIAGIGQDKANAPIAGAELPYSIAGVGYHTEYTYVFSGGIVGAFDALNPLVAGRQFQATGNQFALTVTATNVPDQPVIPEPGSLLALGSGLIGLVGFAARRRK